MSFDLPSSDRLRAALLIVLAVSLATIGGALVFEHGFGLVPCPLCLEQRKPYYAAIVLSLIFLALKGKASDRILRAGLVLLALILVAGSALGVYHAGAEWGFWPGPSTCSQGALGGLNTNDLMGSLKGTRVVSCTEVQWRFLGLSLAGYNVLIAGFLALVAGWGAFAQGSSSVSQ